MIYLTDSDKKWIEQIWQKIEKKLSKNAELVWDIMPYTTENGKYIASKNEGASWWTNGFYGGMMWLMYQATNKDVYKEAAKNQEHLLDEAWKLYDGLHHDVGFMWGLTSKAQYILTGDKESRIRALYAANLLAARINIKGGYIRAWNTNHSYSIIDSMMNIPFLYWSSKELKDNRFRYIAELHADMALKEHIREDGSVVHICVHDEETPRIVRTEAGQGCAVGSAWTRGQAWAIYGFVLSYIHTREERYLEASKKTADYFLENVKKTDYKTVTDFAAPLDEGLFDNSAGACAACGMIELYKLTDEEKYLVGAINILKAMEEDCIFDDSNQSIVQKCMTSYSDGRHVDLIYADFFLCEAILKLKDSNFLIW